MTETVIIAFLIAKIKGYKWRYLFKHWSIYPILLICVIHIYSISLMVKGEYWFLEYAKYIKYSSLSLYFILVWKYKLVDISLFEEINNKKDKPWLVGITSPVVVGALFAFVGSKLNQIAMFYNGNKMPVFPNVSFNTGYSKLDMFEKALPFKDFHIFGNNLTNMIFLTDIFDFFYAVMSIGDIFLRIFVGLVIYYSIKQSNKNKIYVDNLP